MKAQFDHALKLMNEHVANPGRPVALKVRAHLYVRMCSIALCLVGPIVLAVILIGADMNMGKATVILRCRRRHP